MSIIHINDGPVLQFSRVTVPLRLPPLENRTTNASFVEEGPAIALLPHTATLFDVDSLNAAAAQVNIVRMRKGDRLNINVTFAACLGIRVYGSGSPALNLSGIASFSHYRMVRLLWVVSSVPEEYIKVTSILVGAFDLYLSEH